MAQIQAGSEIPRLEREFDNFCPMLDSLRLGLNSNEIKTKTKNKTKISSSPHKKKVSAPYFQLVNLTRSPVLSFGLLYQSVHPPVTFTYSFSASVRAASHARSLMPMSSARSPHEPFFLMRARSFLSAQLPIHALLLTAARHGVPLPSTAPRVQGERH